MAILSFKINSIKQRIVLYCLLIMALVTTLIISVTTSNARYWLLIRQKSKAEIVAANLAAACGDPMMVGEWDRLARMLQEVKKSDVDLRYAIVLGGDGRCVASTEEDLKDKFLNKSDFEKSALQTQVLSLVFQPEDKRMFEVRVPIFVAKEKMGTLRLGYTTKYISLVVRNTIFVSLLIGILALFVASAIYYFIIQRGVVKPLFAVMNVAQQIAMGDLSQKEINVSSKDEIGQLAETFIKMSRNLRDMVLQVRNAADKIARSTQQMSSTIQEVNASTQEVSRAVSQLNTGATIQSERIDETFKLMEQSSITLKQVASDAQNASRGVSEATNSLLIGLRSSRDTVDKINRLVETVNHASNIIQGLGEQSQQIGEITETITTIADQTNLLALNAAIEAARAGEAGRGFAVVAEEVRKLAEGSAEAVKKIGNLIESIQTETNRAVNSIVTGSKEVEEGKEQALKINQSLTEISNTIQEAFELVNQISHATQEQLTATEHLVKATTEIAMIARQSVETTEQVSSSTEEQTASMQEISSSSQELARLAAEELKELVNRFKLEKED